MSDDPTWVHPTMTRAQFRARKRQLLDAEAGTAATWFYFSFCDTDKPEGTQFLGALILKGSGWGSALEGASILGLNPGGEVMSLPIRYTDADAEPWAYRLLTAAEAEHLPPPK
jgi:hypothetical protein